MRKISKSRTDDDVISSTNGSLANDDQNETERNNDSKENDHNSDVNDSVHENDDESSDAPKINKRGRQSKDKAKKRKSSKGKQSKEEEYEVEKIIDAKKIKGKLHYLIRWKGYSANNDTWEPEKTVSCPELITKFNEEKENSKTKGSKSPTKVMKRKAKKGKEKVPPKKVKTQYDSDDDENGEYEVERIMEVHHKKNGSREFLIHWKGWSNKFDSWEPESNLNCPELIKKFMEKDKLKEKDIEFYLVQLKDEWLSEDGQNVENSDEEQFQKACYTREELEDLLQDESNNEEDEEGGVDNPPLVQEHMEVQEDPDSIPSCSIPNRLLDKRKLIWKKIFFNYDQDKVVFLGSSQYSSQISGLETPYQCFMYFFEEVFIQKIRSNQSIQYTKRPIMIQSSIIYLT